MTQQEIIEQLRSIFSEVEKNGALFSEEKFFKRPDTGKWSAAENIQRIGSQNIRIHSQCASVAHMPDCLI